MTRGRRALPVTLLAAIAVAASLAACDGGRPAAPLKPAVQPAPKGEPRVHWFRLEGPRPWNDTVYYATGAAIDGDEPYTGSILDDEGRFSVKGVDEAPYHVRSERQLTPAEARMLWLIDARGTLPAAGGTTVVTAAPRARIAFLAPAGSGGPDAVTLVHEATGTCATTYRDPRQALFLAIWDEHGGNAYRNVAPPRPWVVEDFAPGTYVVAAHTAGRQWLARRVTLVAGETLELHAGAQPEGGATVVCEDGDALLLLDGELPIPAPRITTSLQFRSTWRNVPPGTHKVRYPDGRVVDVEAKDGETLRLPK